MLCFLSVADYIFSFRGFPGLSAGLLLLRITLFFVLPFFYYAAVYSVYVTEQRAVCCEVLIKITVRACCSVAEFKNTQVVQIGVSNCRISSMITRADSAHAERIFPVHPASSPSRSLHHRGEPRADRMSLRLLIFALTNADSLFLINRGLNAHRSLITFRMVLLQ